MENLDEIFARISADAEANVRAITGHGPDDFCRWCGAYLIEDTPHAMDCPVEPPATLLPPE